MTPKERVKAALQHKEPDRVPLGEYGIDYPIIEKVLGRETFVGGKRKLVEAYWQGRRDEVVETMKRDIVDAVRALDFDLAGAPLVPDKDLEFDVPEQLDNDTWEDRHGNILRYSHETKDIMVFKRGSATPGTHPEPPEGADYYPSDSEMEVFRHVVRELGQTHFIYAGASLGPVGLGYADAWGIQDWVLSIAEKPEELREGNLKHAEYVRRCAAFFKKEGADALFLGVDLGYNKGPFLSPQRHREIYLPGFTAWAEASHAEGLPLFFHSCGNNRPLWSQFAESGMDVYQAIQPEEPLADLKREIGDRMTLWGGIDCHKLCFVEPEEIREDVRRNLEAAAPGGGFILGASHSVMVATRYDTYMAALEVGREWRY